MTTDELSTCLCPERATGKVLYVHALDDRQVGVFVCLLMDEATCVGVFVCCELHLMGGMMLSQQGQGHSI